MTYLRARYYDPYQRKFISEDPAKDGLNWYAYCGNNPVMFEDCTGFASMPIVDNGVITDYRLPLRDVVKTLGGTIKLNENSVTVDALGKNIDIPYNFGDHNIGGTLHFTVEEMLNLLGVEYEKEQVSFNVTKGQNKRSTVAFIAREVVNGATIKKAFGVINDIVGTANEISGAIFSQGIDFAFDVKSAVENAGGSRAKVLPAGNYNQTIYRVQTPTTGENSGIIRMTFSGNSDYVCLEKIHWSAEFNSNRFGGGYQDPGYINLYSH